MEITNLQPISVSSGYTQFGRVIEVEVINYELGKKVILNNDLNISFNYFKTTDENRQASTGVVLVKNLSPETFDLVSTRHACQMILRAGYGGNVDTVFVADVVTCKKMVEGSDLNVQFEVSSNYFEYKLNTAFNLNQNKESSIVNIFDDLMDKLNNRRTLTTGLPPRSDIKYVPPASFTQEQRIKYFEYINKAKVKNSFSYTGTLEKIVGDISDEFGFHIFADSYEEYSTYKIVLKDEFINRYLTKIYEPYATVSSSKPSLSVTQLNTAITDGESIILSYTTGLLGTPHVDYKVFTVPENYKGLKSDETTLKSKITIADRNQKQEIREQKAKDKNKTVKPRKLGTKQIKKTYLSAVALLNPKIRPQSIIEIQSSDQDNSGIFRCRSVTYKGENQGPTFVVELYLEDTNGDLDKVATPQEVRDLQEQNGENSNFGDEVNATGQLGQDYREEDSSGSSDGDEGGGE